MMEWIVFACVMVKIFGIPLFTVIALSEPASKGAKAALVGCVIVGLTPDWSVHAQPWWWLVGAVAWAYFWLRRGADWFYRVDGGK